MMLAVDQSLNCLHLSLSTGVLSVLSMAAPFPQDTLLLYCWDRMFSSTFPWSLSVPWRQQILLPLSQQCKAVVL